MVKDKETIFDVSPARYFLQPSCGRVSMYLDMDTFLSQTSRITTAQGLRLYCLLCAWSAKQSGEVFILPEQYGNKKNDLLNGIKELEKKGFLKKIDEKRYSFRVDPSEQLAFTTLGEKEALARVAQLSEDEEK